MRLSDAAVEEAATDAGVDTEEGGPADGEVDTDAEDLIGAGVVIGGGDVTDDEAATDVQAVTDDGVGSSPPTVSVYFASGSLIILPFSDARDGLSASLSTILPNVAGTCALAVSAVPPVGLR